jgi:hypothetical protein
MMAMREKIARRGAEPARPPITLPERIRHDDYIRHPVPPEMIVPEA